MKIKQFLNKMLYASSTIHTIKLVSQGGHEFSINLSVFATDPMSHDFDHYDELSSTLVSFRISGESMTIYCK